jgi:hypothetical protein
MSDTRDLGLRAIYLYLQELVLPAQIRGFWEWYLNLPDIQARYGSADAYAT